MITYEQACKIAYDHFRSQNSEAVLLSASENGEFWIFYGGIPGRVEYGGQGIKIFKATAAKESFILPRDLKILRSATKIDIPQAFTR